MKNLEQRLLDAAEDALDRQNHVTILDVLTGMQLLASSNVEAWKKGRIPELCSLIQGSAENQLRIFDQFLQWTARRGLVPIETPYMRDTRSGPVELRALPDLGESQSEDGRQFADRLEQLFRSRFVPRHLFEKEVSKIVEKESKPRERVAIEPLRDVKCAECGTEIDTFLVMENNQPLCLPCAGLGGLEFLPAGDTALTRRSTKYSSRKIVVVRFSRSRNRYERQGILAEPEAIERAEQECVADAGQRAAARRTAAAARERQDADFTERLTDAILQLYPHCPPQDAVEIARHTAVRGSGRVGRTEAARNLDPTMIELAVRAAVRHRHTDYDRLLRSGLEREAARARVRAKVDDIVNSWRR